MSVKISATIITLNEEQRIADVIKNVQQVCDEVIVVDSLSSDKTVEIAESLGAKVVSQKYLGDGGQKSFCEQFCSYDWILSIDADELLDSDALEFMKTLDLSESKVEGYSFRRRTYIGKKFIRQWYPDSVVRLYDKRKCAYNTAGEHGAVQTKNVQKLPVHMLHYSFSDFGMLVKKADRFAVNLAHVRFESGKRASWYDPFLHGLGAFFKGMIGRAHV